LATLQLDDDKGKNVPRAVTTRTMMWAIEATNSTYMTMRCHGAQLSTYRVHGDSQAYKRYRYGAKSYELKAGLALVRAVNRVLSAERCAE
jgi:hypothetical protein